MLYLNLSTTVFETWSWLLDIYLCRSFALLFAMICCCRVAHTVNRIMLQIFSADLSLPCGIGITLDSQVVQWKELGQLTGLVLKYN